MNNLFLKTLLFVFIQIGFNNFLIIGQNNDSLIWNTIYDGLDISYQSLPDSSVVGDSKLTILRIDPRKNKFNLLNASNHGKKCRTANEWANEFNANVVFNAGMYSLKNMSVSKGYMKSMNHLNNPRINPNYNIVLAFNAKNDTIIPFKIFDLSCTNFSIIQNNYNSISQILRMVDCSGNPMNWDKRPGQKCSMIFIGADASNTLYLFFVRSPYTHNYMINHIKKLPLNIVIAGYLEGGPETSLYIKHDSTVVKKYGSYVSKTYETDKNDHFWKIPNVISISPR